MAYIDDTEQKQNIKAINLMAKVKEQGKKLLFFKPKRSKRNAKSSNQFNRSP